MLDWIQNQFSHDPKINRVDAYAEGKTAHKRKNAASCFDKGFYDAASF
jgi:hypothetical protein